MSSAMTTAANALLLLASEIESYSFSDITDADLVRWSNQIKQVVTLSAATPRQEVIDAQRDEMRDSLAETQRAIIESAERRGYDRAWRYAVLNGNAVYAEVQERHGLKASPGDVSEVLYAVARVARAKKVGDWSDSIRALAAAQQPGVDDLKPIPSAQIWLDVNGQDATGEWQAGWDACRVEYPARAALRSTGAQGGCERTNLARELHDILGDNDQIEPPCTPRKQIEAIRDVLNSYDAAMTAAAPALRSTVAQQPASDGEENGNGQ